MNTRSRINDWLLLFAVSAFFFVWKLAAFGLIGADEPRYAQVAREMLARHDWITPTLGGTPWLEKPPLYYWQAMVAYRLFGVSDWAARLPSVFDAFLLVLAVYLFLRRLRFGSELDGALIVATSAGIVGFSRAASMDMPLAAMFGIAMLAWYAWFELGQKYYLAAFYFFVALAMLAKGPVGPLLAFVAITLFVALERNLALVLKTLWIPGVLVFCVIALPWYLLVQLRNPQFFHEFIVEHNLARFGTNLYHHPEPFWYYIPVALLGLVPWTALALVGLVRAARDWRKDVDTFTSFLLIWMVVVIAFFSISRSKLPGYVLPAISAGSIVAAGYLRQEMSRKSKIALCAFHAALMTGLLFCALVVQYLILQHRVPWGAVAVPLGVSVAAGFTIFAFLIKSDLRRWRIATLVPLIVAVAFAMRFGAQPLDEQLSARPVAEELASFDPHHLPVAVFLVPRETQFGLAFYRNQIIERYELRKIPAGEHIVVAAQGFEKSIARATGRQVRHLGDFPPQKLEFFYVPAQ